MPKMFSSGFKPKSTTIKSKNIIRREINAYYGGARAKDYGVTKAVDAMKKVANAYSAGRGTSDWNKGREYASMLREKNKKKVSVKKHTKGVTRKKR